MQCMKLKFSEVTRSRIGVVLFFINISIIVVCNASGAMGIYMKQEVSSLSNFLAFYNTSSLFKLLFCVSVVFIVFHLVGAKICYDCAFYETRERFHSVLFYWVMAVCALVPLSVAACIVLAVHQDLVLKATELGFRHVMKQYKVDRAMREYVNRLQIEHQCCGARGVSDWYKVSWVDSATAAPVNQIAKSKFMEPNGEFLPRWAPFSCCRQDFIGAACESVSLFFRPARNLEWAKRSRIYTPYYLEFYRQYAAVFDNVTKLAKKPPNALMEKGKKMIAMRHATLDAFLRGVTGHSDLTPPPRRSRPKMEKPSKKDHDKQTETLRILFEAHGVRTEGLPAVYLRKRGGKPLKTVILWTNSNVSEVENFDQHHLLSGDGRHPEETLDLLSWRSFNQKGCAKPIGHNARITMYVTSLLFLYITVAQVLIAILGRYMQTSIDTAYRWGNPMLSTPGYLISTSLPTKPEDMAADRRQGKRLMKLMGEDLAEGGNVTILVAPSWTSTDLEEEEEEEEADISDVTTDVTTTSGVTDSDVTTTDVASSTLAVSQPPGSAVTSTQASTTGALARRPSKVGQHVLESTGSSKERKKQTIDKKSTKSTMDKYVKDKKAMGGKGKQTPSKASSEGTTKSKTKKPKKGYRSSSKDSTESSTDKNLTQSTTVSPKKIKTSKKSKTPSGKKQKIKTSKKSKTPSGKKQSPKKEGSDKAASRKNKNMTQSPTGSPRKNKAGKKSLGKYSKGKTPTGKKQIPVKKGNEKAASNKSSPTKSSPKSSNKTRRIKPKKPKQTKAKKTTRRKKKTKKK